MILAVDQGTSGTTCLVVDENLRTLGRGRRELTTRFPKPGWVEQDPEEIWISVLDATREALAAASIAASELQAIGLTNQRETTLLWERRTGRPVYPAIVWQDRRTAERCRSLPADVIRDRTGLLPDPYFSATKLEWLLQHAGATGELAFGTVDSWLVWRLTGGEEHLTDVSNASRTMLAGLETLAWDEELLRLFGVPRALLPKIRPSSGVVAEARIGGTAIPIAGIAGDQQAALFAQACFEPGQAKATFGTGAFVLMNCGFEPGPAARAVLRTVAWQLAGRSPAYALEGAIFTAGGAVQWLRDGLGLIAAAAETEALATSVDGTGGVHFVPALTGLGAPHWAPEARGLITGLTGATRREHLVRAALESVAYQTRDVVEEMGLAPAALRSDGGMTANAFLMQFLADIVGVPVEVPTEREATALGAAALAGLAVGVWRDERELASRWRAAARYEPRLERAEADRLHEAWRRAVAQAL